MPKRTIAAVVWTLVLLVACLIPGRWLPRDESKGLDLGIVQVDKLVHAFLFAVFGLIWLRMARGPSWTRWVFAAGIALAVATELGQGIPFVGRDPDPYDAVADVVGLLIGFGAYWAIRVPSVSPKPTAVEV